MLKWDNVTPTVSANAAAAFSDRASVDAGRMMQGLVGLTETLDSRHKSTKRAEQEQSSVAALEAILTADASSLDGIDIKDFGVKDPDLTKQLLLTKDQQKGVLQQRELSELTHQNTMLEEGDKLTKNNAWGEIGTEVEQRINDRDFTGLRTYIEAYSTGNERVDKDIRDYVTQRVTAAQDRDIALQDADAKRREYELRMAQADSKMEELELVGSLREAVVAFGDSYTSNIRAAEATSFERGIELGVLDKDGAILPDADPTALTEYATYLEQAAETLQSEQYGELVRKINAVGDPSERENLLKQLTTAGTGKNALTPFQQQEAQARLVAVTEQYERGNTELEKLHTETVRSNWAYEALSDTRTTDERVDAFLSNTKDLGEVSGFGRNRWDRAKVAQVMIDGITVDSQGQQMSIPVTPTMLRLFTQERGLRDNVWSSGNSARKELEKWVRDRVQRGELATAIDTRNQIKVGREQLETGLRREVTRIQTEQNRAAGLATGTGIYALREQVKAVAAAGRTRKSEEELTGLVRQPTGDIVTDTANQVRQQVSAARSSQIDALERGAQAALQQQASLSTRLTTIDAARTNEMALQTLAQEMRNVPQYSPEWRELKEAEWLLKEERMENRNSWRSVNTSEQERARIARQLELSEASLQDTLRNMQKLTSL